MQLRGEAYDLINHANLFVLGSIADASSFQFVQAKHGGIANATTAPGQDTREHRNLQLGVKLTF